ncbi:MAG: hypothetical protein IJU84_07460, partial [Clostridia bacterium]|nr:hypothetical protein [Clostridia bacterium]
MKKLILFLLSIVFTVFLAACSINSNKNVLPQESEPAVVVEGWDNPHAKDAAYTAQIPSGGTFAYDASLFGKDVRFIKEKGLRVVQYLGGGDQISALLPSDAENIRFGAAFALAEDIKEGELDLFVGGNKYPSGHFVYTAFGENSIDDVSALADTAAVVASSVVSMQSRTYDRPVAVRPIVKYSVGESDFYLYADGYNVVNLYQTVYEDYYLKGRSDAANYIQSVVKAVGDRRTSQANVKAGFASLAGDYVSDLSSVGAEGTVYDFTADYASVINYGNGGVYSGISSFAAGVYNGQFWRNSVSFLPMNVYYRTLVDGVLLSENSASAVVAALAGSTDKTVQIVASDKSHEDFLSVTLKPERYVKLTLNDSFVYDRQDHSSSVASIELGADPDVAIAYSGGSAIDAGNYSAVVTVEGYKILNRETNESQTVNYTVTPRKVSVAAENKSSDYGHADVPLTAVITDEQGNLTITAEELGLILERGAGENCGEYPITGTVTSGNYYADEVRPGVYTINKADYTEAPEYISAGVPVLSSYYGNTLADVVLPEGWVWVDPSEVLPEVNADGTSKVSLYSASFVSDDPNYESYRADITVTVSARPVTVRVGDRSATYLAAEPEISADENVTVKDGAGNSDISVSTLGLSLVKAAGVSVGKYALTGDWSNKNYAVTFVYTSNGASVFEIAKKEIEIEWGTELGFVYNGTAQSPEVVASGIIEGDDCAVAVSKFTAAGEHLASAYITGASSFNYRVKSGTVSTKPFTIEKKEVGVLWNNTGYVYNKSAQGPDATATGVVEGDVCVLTVTKYVPAGDHTARVTDISNANYKLPETGIEENYTIEQKTAELVWTVGSYIYNGSAQGPVAAVGNLESGDECSVTTTTEVHAGAYYSEATALSNADYKLP